MSALMHSRWLILGALCFSVVSPLSAQADENEALAPTGLTESIGDVVVDAAILDEARGGADLELYDIKSDGLVTNNQAYNLTTGNNWVTDGSFAGAGGFSTVIQNSGNNVLIQNATIIKLQVQ
ncbi:MAG: hypothetical protein HYU74_09950 [Dechloromonas sp.]|nr:hypothetical protein [Dechloromonas sp.]